MLSYPLRFTFNAVKCLFLARFATQPFAPRVFWVTAASEGEAKHSGGGERLSPPKACWGDPRGPWCPQQPHIASNLLAEGKNKQVQARRWWRLGTAGPRVCRHRAAGGTRRGSGDEPRLRRAHKSHVFDPRGRTEAALRRAGPGGGELPRWSPCGLGRFSERGRPARRGASGLKAGMRGAGRQLAGERVQSAEGAVASWLAGGGEPAAPPISQAALGLQSESGFVRRLPAGKAAGSARLAGCPVAAGFLGLLAFPSQL